MRERTHSSLIEHHFGSGGLVIDQRFSPVIICTWYGRSTIQQVDAYFAWNERFVPEAVARGHKVVFVSDTLDAEFPDATIRRYIADKSEAFRTDERDAVLIGNLVIVPNAAIRGALTAISWFSSRPNTMEPVKNLEVAFRRALEVLRSHGLETPAGFDVRSYMRPVPVEHRASAR